MAQVSVAWLLTKDRKYHSDRVRGLDSILMYGVLRQLQRLQLLVQVQLRISMTLSVHTLLEMNEPRHLHQWFHRSGKCYTYCGRAQVSRRALSLSEHYGSLDEFFKVTG